MKDNQRIALTRRLLKEGLIRLLKEKDMDKISVSELCKESGINRTTFYRHYGMPRDVLMEINNDFFIRLSSDPNIYVESDSLDVRLEKLNIALYQNVDLLRIFMQYLPEAELIKAFETIHAKIFMNTDRGKKLNLLDEQSRRLVYAYHAGGSFFLMRAMLNGDHAISADELSVIRRHLHE